MAKKKTYKGLQSDIRGWKTPTIDTFENVYPDRDFEIKMTIAYRNKGIFHENVVNKIVDDIVKAVKPKKLRLEGVFNPRGGIQTTIIREYGLGKKKK